MERVICIAGTAVIIVLISIPLIKKRLWGLSIVLGGGLGFVRFAATRGLFKAIAENVCFFTIDGDVSPQQLECMETADAQIPWMIASVIVIMLGLVILTAQIVKRVRNRQAGADGRDPSDQNR